MASVSPLNQLDIHCSLNQLSQTCFLTRLYHPSTVGTTFYLIFQDKKKLTMFIYAAVKKYKSKQEKERAARERTEQSGQSAFNTSSQPSYMTKTTQAASQVSLLSYTRSMYSQETGWTN